MEKHKNVRSEASVKTSQNVNLDEKKSQASLKKLQKCKFRWQKLVNLNNQISKFIVSIRKSK